ncbi:MAG: response regulator [Actinobacteria bacterium]|nr:MAG: response regulator [Actinomycetota bacterium]
MMEESAQVVDEHEITILSVDDDPDIRELVTLMLGERGYTVIQAENAYDALDLVRTAAPDLILLDVMMPEVDGYGFCESLQEAELAEATPIIFMTALSDERDKARAFQCGAVDYIVKPIVRDELVRKVEERLAIASGWCHIEEEACSVSEREPADDFAAFRRRLARIAGHDEVALSAIAAMHPDDIYGSARAIGLTAEEMAVAVADQLALEFIPVLDATSVVAGTLPVAFCRKNLIVPVDRGGSIVYVLANPFNWDLLDAVMRHADQGNGARVAVAPPEAVRALFRYGGLDAHKQEAEPAKESRPDTDGFMEESEPTAGDMESRPIVFIANSLILSAVREHASDIHIEPKESSCHIRFRIDGDMRDMMTVKRQTAHMLISRFKAIGGLDIAERRRPQDGMVETTVGGKRLKMRLATTSGPYGESMVIRVLDTSTKPRTLVELGMTEEQSTKLYGYADRAHGMILVVGPTGSGKTTTLYSVLTSIDAERRSLMSVEDPVEYVIARANQQQVNEKAGVTFENLLKSSVRQDPDVLYLGEIRDQFSARTALDFASTGHLTVTTLHTSNATTAIFRLERLGIERGMMADSVLCIVAQRLLKRLCPICRDVAPITAEERAMLAPFTDDIPEQVAHAVGCPECHEGFKGRIGVQEILDFDRDVAEWIRSGVAVADIRQRLRDRGSYLLLDSAIDKVRSLDFTVHDVYERVLVEEEHAPEKAPEREELPSEVVPAAPPAARPSFPQPWGGSGDGEELIGASASGDDVLIGVAEAPHRQRVLIADDDPPTRDLLARVLTDADYEVSLAPDGQTALDRIAEQSFDLIMADINMPGVNGLVMLDRMMQAGVTTPIMMLTGVEDGEAEATCLRLGAADYVRKPVRRDVLLLRVRRVLERR